MGTMLGPTAVRWLVLNLDRSPDRLAAIARSLAALGIGFERIRAVDGRGLAPPVHGLDADLWRATHGREPQPGEVGCYLSHLSALSRFLATDAAHAMVLEDDAVVTAAARDLVAQLTGPGAPDDWDLVRFEAHHGRLGLPIRRLTPSARLCALPFRSAGSAAYLLNRAAAAALLRDLMPMRRPYDLAFDRAWELGIRVRAVLPLPIAAPTTASTIDRSAGAGRRHAPLASKLATKAMRLVGGLHAWCAPNRAFPRPGRRGGGGPVAPEPVADASGAGDRP